MKMIETEKEVDGTTTMIVSDDEGRIWRYTNCIATKMTTDQDLPEAVCALIRNEEGKILAVSRRNKSNDWNLPGGKVDAGETLEQACVREVFEETGAMIKEESLKPIFFRNCDGSTVFRVTTFLAEIDGVPGIKEPGIDVAWIDQSVLPQETNSFQRYNKMMLECLNERISNE